MSELSRDHPLARRRLAKMLMTLGAWLVAFVIVLALLTLLGDELASLPLAWRALVISGVVVTLMVNLVMPVLNVAIARWLSAGPVSAVRRPRARQLASRGGPKTNHERSHPRDRRFE
jgi:antibiotic biosynthesis monooxygenase (ABM) superfamily enzyme